jgi:hypothetical protein
MPRRRGGDEESAMDIKIDVQLPRILREPRNLQEQVNFGIAVGLSRTATAVKAALREEMQKVFDRPTPYTLNSLMVTPATKENLQAEIGFKMFAGKGIPAEKYLSPQIRGGARLLKRFERSLSHAGLLPSGMAVAPASGVDLDAYGNVNRGTIVRILSQLKASSDPMQNQTARSKRRWKGKRTEYFLLRKAHGKLKPGIYARAGAGRVRPIFNFVRVPSYRERFHFYKVGADRANAVGPGQITKAIDFAIRTARD